MLKRKENNDKITISKKELGLFIIIIILAMILCIVASRFISDKIELSNKNTISLSDKLSQIKDNYDITVTKNENGTKTIYTIMCDSDICLYKNNDLEYKELLEYKGKYYTLDQMTDIDNAKLIEVKTDIINTSLNKKYYNLNLIKNIIETSSRDKNEDNKIEAHTSLIRYLKEYNYEYNEINKGTLGEITNIYKDSFGVKCKDKEILITRVKPAGKKEMSSKDYINGKGKEKLLGEILC